MGKAADQLGTPNLLDNRIVTPVTKEAVEGDVETFTEESPVSLRYALEEWLDRTKELRGAPMFIGEGDKLFTSHEAAIREIAKDYPFSKGPFTLRVSYYKHD